MVDRVSLRAPVCRDNESTVDDEIIRFAISQINQYWDDYELLFPQFQIIDDFMDQNYGFDIFKYFTNDHFKLMMSLLQNDDISNSYKKVILALFTFITQTADRDTAIFLIDIGLVNFVQENMAKNDEMYSYFMIIIYNIFEFLNRKIQDQIVLDFVQKMLEIQPTSEFLTDECDFLYTICTYYDISTCKQMELFSNILFRILSFNDIDIIPDSVFECVIRLISRYPNSLEIFLNNDFLLLYNSFLNSEKNKIKYNTLRCLDIIFANDICENTLNDIVFNNINISKILSFLTNNKSDSIKICSLSIIGNICVSSKEIADAFCSLNIIQTLESLYNCSSFQVQSRIIRCFSQITQRVNLELKFKLLSSDFFMNIIELLPNLSKSLQKVIIINISYALRESENSQFYNQFCEKLRNSALSDYIEQVSSERLTEYLISINEKIIN